MNFKKITSLILAVLMVLSVFPLTLIPAFAEESGDSTTAGDPVVPGTAPAKLPGDKAYTTESMFVNPSATLTKSTSEGAEWIANPGLQVSSVSHMDAADGIMFKVDSSMIEEGEDALAFRLLFEVNMGQASWIHLATNAAGAAWYGRNKAPQGIVTTWYYSEDGATWSELKSDPTGEPTNAQLANMPVTAKRGEAYVYIPFSEMYYDASMQEIGSGTSARDIALPAASYTEAKNAGYMHSTTSAKPTGTIRVRVSYDNNAMAESVLSDWSFVYGEAAPTSPTPPTTLPVTGETYKSSYFFKDNFDLMSIYQGKIAAGAYDQAGWQSNSIMTDNATQIIKDGAAGIMFRLDTTKATGNINLFQTTIALQVAFAYGVDGKDANGNDKYRNTYFLATPKQASNFGEAKYVEGMESTWYYSQDGENWNAIVTSNVSHATIPAGKGNTYVYIPMDAFWTKCGETYIKTGTHAPKTADGKLSENLVNWNDAMKIMASDWKFAMSNFYFAGNASQPQLAHDETTVVSSWKALTPGESTEAPIPTDPSVTSQTAPATLPNGETYYRSSFLEDSFSFTAQYEAYIQRQMEKESDPSKITYNQLGWPVGAAEGATQAIKDGAAGIMFKVDTANVSSIAEILRMTFAISVSFGEKNSEGKHPYNTYFLATPKFALNFTEASMLEGATSTWYYSYDGATWNALTSSAETSQHMEIPVGRSYTHVFVPLDALWCKSGATFLATGEHARYTADGKPDPSAETIVNWTDAVELMGDYTLGLLNFYTDGNQQKSSLIQNPNLRISTWRVVTEGELVNSETAPSTLPNGEAYVKTPFLQESYDLLQVYRDLNGGSAGTDFSQTFWKTSDKNMGENAVAWMIDGAQGIVFTIDTNNATADPETLTMAFAISVTFGDGSSTYLTSSPKMAAAFAEALYVDGMSSTWYYSQDGENWKTIETGTAAHATIPAGKGYTHIFVPMDALWTKCGETYLKTGAHAKDADDKAVESVVNWNDAKQYLGKEWKVTLINYYFNGNKDKTALVQDPNSVMYDWSVVKLGVADDVVPDVGGAAQAPSLLPTGEEYKLVGLDSDFAIKGNVYEGKPADSNGTASSAWQSFWFASDSRLSDEEKINFKETGIEIQNSMGIMFKVDTSAAKRLNSADSLKMTVELSVNAPGKSTYFLADPYFVTAYGGKLNVNGASSTWYVSLDGYTWNPIEKMKEANGGVPVINKTSVVYVYIPLDQFWTKGYAAGEDGKRASEALAEMGSEAKITDMKVRLADKGMSCDPNTIISEFSVVKSAYCMVRESVTITDAMAWNIHVVPPVGFTNMTMTFKLGDQSVVAKPEKLEDGSYKYTLAGISAKDMATQITATWTATDASGKAYSETFTTTMETYLRSIMANSANEKYLGVIQSLLHYAAALQTAAGVEGELVNAGLEAIDNIDVSRLKYQVYTNNYTNMWGVPTLDASNGATTVKVPVTPPSADYNKVRFETETGRVGTVDIKDGYAYIPVYAHEMRLTIKLDFYKSGSLSDAGSMTFSLSYLIVQSYAANADVTQALLNFCNEARKLQY